MSAPLPPNLQKQDDNLRTQSRKASVKYKSHTSTVLEQDLFYSSFLVLHMSASTNSQSRDDVTTRLLMRESASINLELSLMSCASAESKETSI